MLPFKNWEIYTYTCTGTGTGTSAGAVTAAGSTAWLLSIGRASFVPSEIGVQKSAQLTETGFSGFRLCGQSVIRTSIISETRQENSELIGFIPAAVPDRFLNEFGSKFRPRSK